MGVRTIRAAVPLAAVSVMLGVMVQSCAKPAPPQLGKQSVQDVVAAMTKEEKVNLVVGLGMTMEGLPPDMQGPAVGQTNTSVPGAAGATFAIPRLGIPSIVVADDS